MDAHNFAVPINALLLLLSGLFLLTICLFGLTYPRHALFFQLSLGPLAIWSFLWFISEISEHGPSRAIVAGMTTVGLYGIMRVLEHTLIHILWDPKPPRWILRGGRRESSPLPMPETFGGRCFYALDLLTSQRGLSWDADLVWDWCPPTLRHWKVQSPSRPQFILNKLKWIFLQLLGMDLCERIFSLSIWEDAWRGSFLDSSLTQQLVISSTVCAGTVLSISFYYNITATSAVLLGSSPNSWPPMFISPFGAHSLKEFWSRRWHLMFRRVFDRMSLPFIRSILAMVGQNAGVVAGIVRGVVTFTASAILHLIVMQRVGIWDYHNGGEGGKYPTWWDTDVFEFFVIQAVGVLVEVSLLEPAIGRVFPQKRITRRDRKVANGVRDQRNGQSIAQDSGHVLNDVQKEGSSEESRSRWEGILILRLYAWLFLLWTGRWWTNKWAQVGFLTPQEKVVPVSILAIVKRWYAI